jgi:hypothetical protein
MLRDEFNQLIKNGALVFQQRDVVKLAAKMPVRGMNKLHGLSLTPTNV